MVASDEARRMEWVVWVLCERCGAMGPRIEQLRLGLRTQCCGYSRSRLNELASCETDRELRDSRRRAPPMEE